MRDPTHIARCSECDMFSYCVAEAGMRADDEACWRFLPVDFFG